jgi:hypothetical protein
MFEFIMLFALLILTGWSAWIDTIWIAAIAVVFYIAGGWLFGDLSHLTFLFDPITLICGPLFSLAVGATWSLWKWRRWMLSDRVQRVLRRSKDEHQKSGDDIFFKHSVWFPSEARASKNVERIITWIMLWPFSMLVYFFEDFLMDIGRWIYNRLGQVYVRITDAALPDDMK